jgi:diguanylate cyclase (GGDEF)-like protein
VAASPESCNQTESALRLHREERAKLRLRSADFDLLRASLATLLCGFAFAANAARALEPSAPLPTLTTARQAHSLHSDEARRAYPVHLKAVVTYYDPDLGNGYAALFVTDATGSIWVNEPANKIPSMPAGTLVDVTGVTDNGLFAPYIASPHIVQLGQSQLPATAVRVNHASLFSGIWDGQWIEVEGTVHSFTVAERDVTVRLEMPDGALTVLMMRKAGADYSKLVDAKVLIRGNAAPIFSRTKYQMVGARLMAPGLAAVKIVEAAPLDSFSLPVAPVDSLMRWNHISILKHRVHLRGTVTLLWPGSSLCIRDDSGSICMQTREHTPIAVGDIADVIGFAEIAGDAHILTEVDYRPGGRGESAPATPMQADVILHGLNDSELISIDGELIGRDQASSDTTLMLSAGKVIFTAVLPKSLADPQKDVWKTGSRLRITGICSISVNTQSSAAGEAVAEGEGLTVAKSFKVLMRSPNDIVVLQKASWWTPAHVLVLLALALIATLGALVWVLVLRKRVEEQARMLRESEGRFRHMALHDSLTGVASRALLDDRLNAAVETARRRETGLALLMVDLDQFKEINDTFGHHGGDQVLRVTADRLVQAVRKTDTVARMGGDEFVALLPDFDDLAMVEGIATKIVKSLAEPVDFAGRDIPVSVSVGVCTSAAGGLDVETLLRCADNALYQAKAKGRNCFHISASAPACCPAEPGE